LGNKEVVKLYLGSIIVTYILDTTLAGNLAVYFGNTLLEGVCIRLI